MSLNYEPKENIEVITKSIMLINEVTPDVDNVFCINRLSGASSKFIVDMSRELAGLRHEISLEDEMLQEIIVRTIAIKLNGVTGNLIKKMASRDPGDDSQVSKLRARLMSLFILTENLMHTHNAVSDDLRPIINIA